MDETTAAHVTSAPSPERARKRIVRLCIGIALSGVALWLALRRTSVAEVLDALRDVGWPWVAAMLVMKATVLIIKSIRWKVELRAMRPGTYTGAFRAIGLGYFGNLILPFKLGEVLRVGLLKRHNPDVGLGDALATVAAERALDGAVLAIMVGAVLPGATVPQWVMRGTLLLLFVMLGVIAVSMLTPLHNLALRILPQAGPLAVGRRVVQALTRGTAVLRNPRALAAASALTGLAWFGEALGFWCALQALGLSLAFSSAMIVTLLLSVGLLIPSAPGQIGTHQALAVLFLAPFGVASGAAVSLSIVMQAVALTTLGSIGGYVFIREAAARELVRERTDP